MKRQQETYFTFLCFITILIAVSYVLLSSRYSYAAACIAGLPCVVDLTPNDPFDDTDGPNAPGAPNATKSQSEACDADFMNQIYARAYIEAERETLTNEVVIRKPDSVLEYTCFDQLVSLAAHHAGPIFSESDRWHNVNVDVGKFIFIPLPKTRLDVYMGDTNLDNVLEYLVLDSLNTYIDSNFYHNLLGGAAQGMVNTISNAIGADTLDCAIMSSIYNFAQCSDFATDDQFLSFETLKTLDPRLLPEQCDPPETAIMKTPEYVDVAANLNDQYVFRDFAKDTYLDLMTFSFAGGCEDPRPTGIMVTREIKSIDPSGNVQTVLSSTYEEKVCPNPSCHYNELAKQCLP